MRYVALVSALTGTFSLLATAAVAQPAANTAPIKQFTQSEKANPRLARTLGIPAFFALPDSARGAIPAEIRTTDTLVDFRHPDGNGKTGLRIIETARRGMAERLAASGLVQTGDLILSFWPDWGGAGPYPNVQMGVSHVGVAYVKDGKLNNLDNPLNAEYNSPSDLRSANYKEVFHMHVVRPRGLTDAQRANLMAWVTRFNANQGKIYPSQLSFNADYNAPKFKTGQSPAFVGQVARMALGQTADKVALYCSEFAWAVLSLRDCDPERGANQFSGSGLPSCVREPMTPMLATGDYMMSRGRRANAGLADGPLLAIDQMSLTPEARATMLDSVFKQTKSGNKMSPGHRAVAQQMAPKFAPLSLYYKGVYGSGAEKQQATAISDAFRKDIPQNYSPTSFLVNTLLPTDNPNRTMDYIATIVVK